MITHIDYKFDDDKLLEEVKNLKFKRVFAKATEYSPAEDGLVYLDTGSIVRLDEDQSHFEKTEDLSEGYFYDLAKELCHVFEVKQWRAKVLRYSPGDKIFSHIDSISQSPCAINHLFGGESPIIINGTQKIKYKTAIIDIGNVFHKVKNEDNNIRYTFKVIPMDKTYDELKKLAANINL